ncbi:MAG: AAA family ATPase [Bacilli bacterium]|nr:AAA family ATPase [Bacilli bacterium]
MPKLALPLGVDDFGGAARKYYVDKTLLINDIITQGEEKSILITRPRRFGKSLALSMVDYYFDIKKDSASLFQDKKIQDCGEYVLSKRNAYPVIHLNMKGIEAHTPSLLLSRVKDRVITLYRNYPELATSEKLSPIERQEYQELATHCGDEALFISALERLCRYLEQHYGQKVILLLDEYGAPIESAYQNGFYEEIITFFKSFYGDAFKGNSHLYFALITGVLQVSKESLFSGLNNLVVSCISSRFLAPYFGFSREEVQAMLDYYEIHLSLDQLWSYYGGYALPDGEEIANPWSVLSFVSERKLRAYWANTGENALLRRVIHSDGSRSSLLDFLNNETKKSPFYSSLSYRDLGQGEGLSLSFLAATGYLSLKADPENYLEDLYSYAIPNKEIYGVFKTEVIGKEVDTATLSLAEAFKSALSEGDAERIKSILEEYLLSALSYYDLQDERNYHNAITGMLAVLFDEYIVKNEVASGTGRCDIILIPKSPSSIGIVIEVKRSKSKAQLSKARLQNLSLGAIEQIKKKDYTEWLRKADCSKILLYGFAFQNKTAAVATETLSNSKTRPDLA